MRKYLTEEITIDNIFRQYSDTYGLVLINPFQINDVEKFDVKLYRFIKSNNNSISTEVCSNDYDIHDGNINVMANNDNNIIARFSFSQDSLSQETAVYFNIKDTIDLIGAEVLQISKLVIEKDYPLAPSFFATPEDSASINNRIVVKGNIDEKLKSAITENVVMTILFKRSFDIPEVKVFLFDNEEDTLAFADNAVNTMTKLFNADDSIIDLSRNDIEQYSYMVFSKPTIKMRSPKSFDESIDINFFPKMYSLENPVQGFKSETFDIKDAYGKYITVDYINYMINVKRYYIDGTFIYTCNDQKIYGYSGINNDLSDVTIDLLKDLSNGGETPFYIVKDKDGDYHYGDDINNDDEAIISINFSKEKIPFLNPDTEYKIATFKSKGINFRYIYDHVNNVYIYMDGVNMVIFKLYSGSDATSNGYEVDVVDAAGPIVSVSKVFIRDVFGVPIFFNPPKKED